jgi:hypothetical protein
MQKETVELGKQKYLEAKKDVKNGECDEYGGKGKI